MKKPIFWQRKEFSFLKIILTPFTLLIILNNLIRKFCKKKKFEIKTICVGNIYIGGTGKTPLSIEVYRICKNLKINPVFIKKFYSNQKDEQNLIKNIGPIICKKSRINAIKTAEFQKFKTAIIDDGLQDRDINYDFKIVCFDKNNFIGNGALIPAGPLREKLASIQNYDAVFFNGPNRMQKKFKSIIKKIKPNIEIFETNPKLILTNKIKKNKKYLAFAGIGNPQNFHSSLINNNFKISKFLSFPDHYEYSNFEIEEIKKIAKSLNSKILTTEKDYFRINKKNRNKIQYIKIKTNIINKKRFVNILKKI